MLKVRLLFLLLFSSLHGEMDSTLRRVWAHLLIQDQESAFKEAEKAHKSDPDLFTSHQLYLHALARCRDERNWYKEWIRYKERYPEEAYEAKGLEEVAWAVLERASKASSAQVRQLGLIAAGMTRDVRALPIILQGMRDRNGTLREIAVEFAVLYRDAPLKKELAAAYQKESLHKVRVSMIRAFGQLHMEEMIAPLLLTLEEGDLTLEEQHALIAALVHLSEGIEDKELTRLARSERSSFRLLAAEMITKYQMRDKLPLLWELTRDGNPMVVASALKSMGLLRIKESSSLLLPFITSSHPTISITACWLAKLQGDEGVDERLAYWVREGEGESRVVAAAAIAGLGPYGVLLARDLLEKTDDPFVRANLALALVGERYDQEMACTVFASVLQENTDRWMAEPILGGLFTPLKKSTLAHRRGMAHYPEMMSQVIRLKMVSLLAVLEYEGVEQLMKEFLSNKNWQVTGLAAELLLEQGESEEVLTSIRALLEEKDPLIALEAALVLAVLGRDSSAVPTLLKVYEGATVEVKVRILEALSRIGEKSTIPFLVDCLNESSHLLRIIAASVLLQTMNH